MAKLVVQSAAYSDRMHVRGMINLEFVYMIPVRWEGMENVIILTYCNIS